MKFFVVAFLGITTIIYVSAKPGEKYTTKYDNIDIDEIIKSDRLTLNYMNCLLEKGNCSPDGAELKSHIPDALLTECTKCSEKQKTSSRKILHHLIDNKRDWWNELEAKYDPTGIYKKKYDAKLKADGINL